MEQFQAKARVVVALGDDAVLEVDELGLAGGLVGELRREIRNGTEQAAGVEGLPDDAAIGIDDLVDAAQVVHEGCGEEIFRGAGELIDALDAGFLRAAA
ncbi:MAG: hypothetical protein IPK83_21390, partial [Planctomycetes bacterium]|nr:hypothetical protein [Planctomycetota bacterium]